MAGPCDDRTCHIRASSGKGLDFSVIAAAVESGDHGVLLLSEPLFHGAHGLAVVQSAFLVKEDHLKGIHKGITQIPGHDAAVQVLSAGGREIGIRIFLHPLFDLVKLFIKGEILQLQTFNDLGKALLDLVQDLRKVLSVFRLLIHPVEKIGHFGITGKALARRRRDHISSALISTDNVSHFFKLFRIGERAPAKLYYFHFFCFLGFYIYPAAQASESKRSCIKNIFILPGGGC